MLQWTKAGFGPTLAMIVHHTDAKREWAYDRDSHIGTLNKGLDMVAANGFVLIDMKNDWNVIFPVEGE